ncbi:MAG: PAS domain S-box protein, partial [Gammaproteobacteria bacterium]
LTLTIIVLLYSLSSYIALMKNLHDRQQVRNQNYARELAALLRSTAADLQQVAEMVPFLGGVESALHNRQMPHINQVLERYWTLMQIQNGIELLRIHDRRNDLVAIKSAVGVRFPDDGVMKKWISDVNASEKPISPVICHDTCMQFVIAPLLIRGEKVGVIALGISLADVLLRFKQLTGDDIGLLVDKSDKGMRLPGWQSHVSGLTNKQESFAILQQASLTYPQLSTISEGIQIHFHERIMYIKLFPLPAMMGTNNANFIVMTDVTRSVSNIHDSIRQIVMVGIAGLLASGLVMWMMFTQLLSRLKDMAYLLPMLSKRNFREFRSALDAYSKAGRFHDEVDKLYEAASTLSVQLENLEKKAQSRARKLSEQKKVLRRERDFVSHLLNTAQVIVLTQNQRGKILSLNRFGRELLQYEADEIISAPFVCFLSDGETDPELNKHLKAMREGHLTQYRHESLTLCKDGSTRNIAWLHSKLDCSEEDEPAILSVGLDVTEYKRVETHLAWLADHDPLTNLFNRRRFSEELQHMIER